MAEIQAQTIRGILSSLVQRTRTEMKTESGGLVGGLIEKLSGEIESYNRKLEEHAKLKLEALRITKQLNEVERKQAEIRQKVFAGLLDEEGAAEEAYEELDRLGQETATLTKEQEDLAEKLNTSTNEIRELSKGSGLLSNGLTILTAKVGGLAAGLFSWHQMLEAIDKRLDFGARHVIDYGTIIGSYGDTIGQVTRSVRDWDTAINRAVISNTKYGVGAEETIGVLTNLSKELRLTVRDGADLAAVSGQMAEDIGFMSTLLGASTEELANATTEASKRFGKSTKQMSYELAGLFNSLDTLAKSTDQIVISFGDLTKATLDAQSSFQGYNFNLRGTAQLLTSVVAKAQEQGATYEMSMKAAKGLADVIAGGAAPDWAKFMAGKELRSELVEVVDEAKRSGADIQETLKQTFGKELTDAQLKGLKNLAENWREYGELSSSYMADELLRGTEAGNRKMFALMKKTAGGREGRELLKRVWNLDDQAATAATLAMQGAESYDDFLKLKGEAEKATGDRKPPSVKDLKDSVGRWVEVTANAQKGIGGTLSNIFDLLKSNPYISGAVGLAGFGLTGGLQLMQSALPAAIAVGLSQSKLGTVLGQLLNRLGAPVGVAGRALGAAARGARALPGRTLGLLRAAPDALGAAARGVRALPGRAMGAAARGARALPGHALGLLRAAPDALVGLAKAATPAAKGLLGMAGPLAKLAAKGGGLMMAGAAGYALGKVLYDRVPGIRMFGDALGEGIGRLIGFRDTISDAEAAQKGLANASAGVQQAIDQVQKGIVDDYESDSYAHMVAARQLKDMRDDDLAAYAESIAKRTGMSKDELMQRLRTLRAEQVDDRKFREAREKMIKSMSPIELSAAVAREAGARIGRRREGEDEAAYQARLARATEDVRASYEQIRGGAPMPKRKAIAGPSAAPLPAGRDETAVARGLAGAERAAKPPPVVTVEDLSDEQKRAVTQQVAETLAPEMRETAQTLFQQMAQQSTSYFEQATKTSQWFWQTHLPESTSTFWTRTLPQIAEQSWGRVASDLGERLGLVPTAVPLAAAPGPAEGRTGRADVGRAGRFATTTGSPTVSPDGSIRIQVMIPRNAIDTSNAVSAGYTE